MVTDDTRIDLGIDGLGPAEHIGRGGSADVYRAEQLSQRRIVAVKVLRAQVTDADAEAQFERECYALGSVSDHPHIVGVHEGGFTRNGRAYLVMEYLPGGSLLDRLERFGVMSPADVVQIGVKIGTALDVAHRAGVLHRDIKPANIMISKHGEPALGDFGIARIEGGNQGATGVVTASFLHTSPEVLEGQPSTPTADIYSLASTMYELVSGNAPYYEPNDESVWPAMKRILGDPFPSPAPFGMSPEFCQLFDRATARNPNLRYRDAGEFAQDLRRTNPGSVRDRDDAGLRAELRAAAGGESSPPSHPVDLASEAPFLDHRLGMEPAPTADIGGPARAEFKARQQPVYPVVAQEATPIGKPDVTTLSSTGTRPPLDVRGPRRPAVRMAMADTYAAPYQYDSDFEIYDRQRSSKRVGLKALTVVALSVALVAITALAAFRLALWAASELRESDGNDTTAAQDVGVTGTDIRRQALSAEQTSSADLALDVAAVGPLIAGQTYTPVLGSSVAPESVRFLIDGQPTDAGGDPNFVMPAGRHVVQAEILAGDQQGITKAIDIYGLESHSETGVQVNLASAPGVPEQWPSLLATFDQLVIDGHTEARIGSDDQPSGVTWRIFVSGFGDDSTAAETYCEAFAPDASSQCFVGPALVSEATG